MEPTTQYIRLPLRSEDDVQKYWSTIVISTWLLYLYMWGDPGFGVTKTNHFLVQSMCSLLSNPLNATEYYAVAQDDWPSHAEAVKLLEDHGKLVRRSPPRLARRGEYSWVIRGRLSRSSVAAYPDTGSSYNLLSRAFVQRQGFSIEKSKSQSISLPGNRTIASLGTVSLPFRFHNEAKENLCAFQVLENCAHDVVLGRAFLTETETLTKHRHRVQRVRQSRKETNFHLVGAPSHLVNGTINGREVCALPDTGSDFMIMSKALAESLDLHIDANPSLREILRLADGTLVQTEGVVYDVDWAFEGQTLPHRYHFHVLDELNCDVVLSNEYLFETEAFWMFEHGRTEYDSITFEFEYVVQEEASLCGGNGEVYLMQRASKPPDKNSDDAYTTWIREEELESFRRGKEEDRIASLPVEERDTARAIELDRRRDWESQRPPQPQRASTPPTSGISSSKPRRRLRLARLFLRRK